MIFWTALRGSQNTSVALLQMMNHGFWSTTPSQSWEWQTANSPRPKKARMSKSKIKSMLICGFFLGGGQSGDRPPGICATRTDCQTFYREVLERRRKRMARATRRCTHLDAATRQRPMSHGSLHQLIFGRKSIPMVPQPPYSPDLSPCDFLLFLRLKNHLKGRHFGTLDNI